LSTTLILIEIEIVYLPPAIIKILARSQNN
jgi:hypothetical protein